MNRLAFPACVPFIGQFSVLPPGSFDQGGEPLENTFTWNRCIPVYVLRSIRHEVQAPHRSLIRHPVRVATVAPPAAAPPDPGAPSSGLVRVRRSPGTARNPRQLDRWLQVHPPRRTPASSPARNAFASCPHPFLAAGLVLCRLRVAVCSGAIYPPRRTRRTTSRVLGVRPAQPDSQGRVVDSFMVATLWWMLPATTCWTAY